MEREHRELYDYHESPPHQSQNQQPHLSPQTVHITQNHPHLRHVGHPQTSLICIQQQQQPPTHHHHHQQQPTIIATSNQSSSQIPQVQSQSQPEPMQEQFQLIKKEATTHFATSHHQAGGEMRPSVIESNQPMVIECT